MVVHREPCTSWKGVRKIVRDVDKLLVRCCQADVLETTKGLAVVVEHDTTVDVITEMFEKGYIDD